jgi:hypothetical protein
MIAVMLTCGLAGIMGVLMVVFLLSSLFSLYCYTRIPTIEAISPDVSEAQDIGLAPRRSCCDELEDIAANVWQGYEARLCRSNSHERRTGWF